MLNVEDFDNVFEDKPSDQYEPGTIDKIRESRSKLGGHLLVEKLLGALGIQEASRLYPPKSDSGLREIHHQIISSTSPDHHKHSVLFYLLKDISHKNDRGPQQFAQLVYLPAKYESFIEGIWLMDRMRFEKALDYLTDPALTPTFPDETLYILCKFTRPHEIHLPIAYYNCVSPPLADPKILRSYYTILCRADIMEALRFSRHQEDATRSEFFKELVTYVLKQPQGEKKAMQTFDLTCLPIDEWEQKHLFDLLQKTTDRNLTGHSDLMTMWDTVIGKRETGSVGTIPSSSKRVHGIDWSTVASAIR